MYKKIKENDFFYAKPFFTTFFEFSFASCKFLALCWGFFIINSVNYFGVMIKECGLRSSATARERGE